MSVAITISAEGETQAEVAKNLETIARFLQNVPQQVWDGVARPVMMGDVKIGSVQAERDPEWNEQLRKTIKKVNKKHPGPGAFTEHPDNPVPILCHWCGKGITEVRRIHIHVESGGASCPVGQDHPAFGHYASPKTSEPAVSTTRAPAWQQQGFESESEYNEFRSKYGGHPGDGI
jgi:hypothetical protein